MTATAIGSIMFYSLNIRTNGASNQRADDHGLSNTKLARCILNSIHIHSFSHFVMKRLNSSPNRLKFCSLKRSLHLDVI